MSISYFAEGTGFAFMLAAFFIVLVIVTLMVSRSKYGTQTGNIAISSFFISLGFVVLVLSTGLQQSAFMGNEAAMIPRLWAFILIPSSIFLIYRSFTGVEDEPEKAGRLDKVAIVAITLMISVFLMKYLGYFVCSGAFVFISMYVLGYKRILPMVVISSAWVAFAYFIFYRLLFVGLPIGSLMKAIFNI